MKSGIVFDIQRFALHDGPGIRTTVFLKGCPLRCLWCHNPESQSYEPQLSFRRDLCEDTFACLNGNEVHRVADGRHEVDFARAAGTTVNTEVCPHGALTMIGRRMTVEEVLDEVERDRPYYEHSEGGITLSGGEPLGQFEFAVELLAQARLRKLHTCLDTSGLIATRKMAVVSGLVDVFLFDYKATNREEHRRLTGAPNDLIIRNLDFLYQRGATIVLRCPLVPGVNDSHEHLKGIADLCARYPRLAAIEIMAYHNMGRDKAARVGMEYPLGDLPSADEDTRQQWLSDLRALGCVRAEIG